MYMSLKERGFSICKMIFLLYEISSVLLIVLIERNKFAFSLWFFDRSGLLANEKSGTKAFFTIPSKIPDIW